MTKTLKQKLQRTTALVGLTGLLGGCAIPQQGQALINGMALGAANTAITTGVETAVGNEFDAAYGVNRGTQVNVYSGGQKQETVQYFEGAFVMKWQDLNGDQLVDIETELSNESIFKQGEYAALVFAGKGNLFSRFLDKDYAKILKAFSLEERQGDLKLTMDVYKIPNNCGDGVYEVCSLDGRTLKRGSIKIIP